MRPERKSKRGGGSAALRLAAELARLGVLDAAALEGARRILPAENRRALYEQVSAARGFDEVAVPFAEAVPIAFDAPAIDRLVAWCGRDPGWGSRAVMAH